MDIATAPASAISPAEESELASFGAVSVHREFASSHAGTTDGEADKATAASTPGTEETRLGEPEDSSDSDSTSTTGSGSSDTSDGGSSSESGDVASETELAAAPANVQQPNDDDIDVIDIASEQALHLSTRPRTGSARGWEARRGSGDDGPTVETKYAESDGIVNGEDGGDETAAADDVAGAAAVSEAPNEDVGPATGEEVEEQNLEPEQDRNRRASWVGFVDFGDGGGGGGGASGDGQSKQKPRKPRKLERRFGRGRRRKSPPSPWFPPGGPPPAPGCPAIALTEPTPPTSLTSEDAWSLYSDYDENGTPRKSARAKRPRRLRRGESGVEALDKYHRKPKRSAVVQSAIDQMKTKQSVGSTAVTAAVGGAATSNGGRTMSLLTLSSIGSSMESIRSRSCCACQSKSPRWGEWCCKALVLLSLGVAVALAVYFGLLAVGETATIAAVMDKHNCTTITDCDRQKREAAAEVKAEPNGTFDARNFCAVEFCYRACQGDGVTRCADGLCVMNTECNDNGGLVSGEASSDSRNTVRFVMLGILVFALSCCVGTATLMTSCTRSLCSLCCGRRRKRTDAESDDDDDSETDVREKVRSKRQLA